MSDDVSWDRTEELRSRTPVDPWPAAPSEPYRPATRQVYGRVYELITGDRRDGPHPYVGQTTGTIHQRVHGTRGHTSPESVARDPWKARILPGRAGYRQLKVIYATGNPGADQVRLDMAEAFAIAELKTTHNTQRPIRDPGPAPARPAVKLSQREVARRRRVRWARVRVACLLAFVALFTVLAARVAVAMQMPWPAFPWVVAPAVGTLAACLVFDQARRFVRKLTR